MNVINNNYLTFIRNKFVLEQIMNNLVLQKLLNIIRYNKRLQINLEKNLNFYKEYTQIEIEINPIEMSNEEKNGPVINIENENDRSYYHIYFDGNEE